MKQNKVTMKTMNVKSSLNGVQKRGKVKDGKKSVLCSPAKRAPGRNNVKKAIRKPIKIVPPKEPEQEENDNSEEEEETGAAAEICVADEGTEEDSAASEENEMEDVEEGSGEDEDDDDGFEGIEDNETEDDDNIGTDENTDGGDTNDEDKDDIDDDEEPIEAPIDKESNQAPVKAGKAKKAKSVSMSGIPKIKTAPLPKGFPIDQILIVKNLPKRFKQIDLVEVFAKFGTLHTIHNVHGPVSSIAYVAYTSPEEAEAAAVATNKIAKVKGIVLSVTQKKINPNKTKKAELKQKNKEEYKHKMKENKDRTIVVSNINYNVTIAQLKEYFSQCGQVESVNIYKNNSRSSGFVTFNDKSAVAAAKKLNNSIFGNRNITVSSYGERWSDAKKDPRFTVTVRNKQNLEMVENEKLEAIFSECGEIEDISILCCKSVLAFVTFKNEESAKKAFNLSGTTVQGLKLDIAEYKDLSSAGKTTVFVQNVKHGVQEDEIRNLFASAGPIEKVDIGNGFATVKFENSDGFCKAFLLNESTLHGQMIFLEPFSEKKQKFKIHFNPFLNRKRAAPNGNRGFRGNFGKKFKAN